MDIEGFISCFGEKVGGLIIRGFIGCIGKKVWA